MQHPKDCFKNFVALISFEITHFPSPLLFIGYKIFLQTFLMASFIFGFFQQWRLIPKLAATYALTYFARTFHMNFVQLQIGMMMGEKGETQVSVLRDNKSDVFGAGCI